MIEKICARLEEAKFPITDLKQGVVENQIQQTDDAVLYKRAIEIVQEVAKEYGNDWIPVEERIPIHNGWYLVTNELGVVQQQYWGANHWHKLRDEAVVAWCELPTPYQKGE